MIISIHLPKTAGTSFRQLLVNEFGGSLLPDYHVYPRMLTNQERIVDAHKRNNSLKKYKKYLHSIRNIKCIHGHFLGIKYNHYLDRKETQLVTWLRDPAERLASHYYFWKRTYEAHIHNGIRKQMMEENWTLEEFAMHPMMRNRCSFYLTNINWDRFSFVGIVENMETDIQLFARKYLSQDKLDLPELNRSQNRESYYKEDPELLEKIKQVHSKDYDLYNYFLKNPRH